MDGEFTPNPHDPWCVATKLAIPEAVPYLINVVERHDSDLEFAIHALQLLEELAKPPRAILPGGRSQHRNVTERNLARAAAAEGAGLYPVAARYFGRESADRQRNIEATQAHMARLP